MGVFRVRVGPATGPALSEKDAQITQSGYGNSISQVYGPIRVKCEVIWATPKVRIYSYFVPYESDSLDIALALCDCFDGPIAGVGRVWADNELLWDLRDSTDYETYIATLEGVGTLTLYKGTASQAADPTIVAREGSSSAYRYLAYMVLKDFRLGRWDNSLPNLEAEVIPVGTLADSISYLDTASLLGTNANGSIRPDGLLIVVHVPPSGNNQAHVRNPFTLASLKQLALAFNPPLTPAPAMNKSGDAILGTTLVRADGSQQDVCIANSGTIVEASGAFVMAGRFGSTDYGVRRIQPDGSYTVLTTFTTNVNPVGFAYDGTHYYVSWDSFLGIGLRKITASGATVLEVTGSGAAAYGMAIAGDGSVFYRDGGSNRDLYRRSADFSSVTQIVTGTGFNNTDPHTRLARNWRGEGILYFSLGQLRRFAQDGTLLQTIVGSGVDGYVANTHPNYPDRIYAWSTVSIAQTRHCVVARFSALSAGLVSLGSVYSRIAQRAGLTAGEIDTSTLTGEHKGSAVLEQASARDLLEPLNRVYSVQVIDQGAKIKFATRGAAAVASIPADDLILLGDGESYATDEPTIGQESELPVEVTIGYLQVGNSYIANAQYDRRLVTQSKNAVREDYAIAMSNRDARRLASTRLYLPWIQRHKHKFATSRKYAHLEPGDVVDINTEAGAATVLLTRIRDEGTVRYYEAEEDDAAAFTQDAEGADGLSQDTTVSALGPTDLQLLDIPLLDAAEDDYGLNLAAAGYFSGWPGAQLYKSSNGGTNYVDTGVRFAVAAAIGTASAALGNFAGGNIFDEHNVLDVVLSSGTLTSLTEAQVLAGTAPILIGSEIVGVENRPLVSGTTYRLSGLWRGLYGTEWAMGLHRSGEAVVVLDAQAIRNLALRATELGTTRQYKGLTTGSDLAFAAAQSLTLKALRLKPLSPVQLGGGRNASGDIVLAWVRRARHSAEWRDLIDVPLDETAESYEVDVFAGTAVSITAITQAADGQFTTSGAHGLSVGSSLYAHSIGGMTQLNERAYIVATVPSTTTFTVGENTTSYPAYTSGGSILKRKPSGVIAASTPTATYTSAQQTTDYGGNQSNVRWAVQQISARVGRGYPATAST